MTDGSTRRPAALLESDSSSGASSRVSDPGRPPLPGVIMRLVTFVAGSVRSQPLLSLSLFAITLWLGLGRLWSMTPMWHAPAQVHIGDSIGGGANESADHQLAVSASDLRDLIMSQSTIDEILQSADFVALAQPNQPSESWIVRGASWSWQTVTGVGDWFSSPRDGQERDVTTRRSSQLRVNADIDDATHRVLRLTVVADSPERAARAPERLLEHVRSTLLREAHAAASRRIDEIEPRLATARGDLAHATSAITDYRVEIGRHNPDETADQLQKSLTSVKASIAELETDLKEAEANQIDIEARLGNVNLEQTSRVIIEESPRVRELTSEIASLEAEYESTLAVKTAKHPDMVRLRLEIENKKRDLNNQELLVVREKVQEPSLEYVMLLERKDQNHRQLVTLAGRELGLAESANRLQTELATATLQAERMAELRTMQNEASSRVDVLQGELDSLNQRRSSDLLYSHLTLVGTPRVKDSNRPDSPEITQQLSATFALAVVLSLLIPTLRAWMGGRIVTMWQVERIGACAPLEIVGEVNSSPLQALTSVGRTRRSLPG